jgi:hypothetical protein
MQCPGEICRTELNPTTRKHRQNLDFKRVNHIDERDAVEGFFQMLEVDVTKVSASENRHMTPTRKLPSKKIFAGLKVALPKVSATLGAVANGDLLGQETVRSCHERGRSEAPFQ